MSQLKTAVIIEDEVDANDLLTKIIEEYCPDLELIGSASSLIKGKELIESSNPDIVFLDIQIGCETGFQLLDMLDNLSFKLIITTAFQEFALKAFQYEAIDYILKPYSPKSIVQAMEKVKKQLVDTDVYRKLENLISEQLSTSKITLSTSEGYTIVCPQKIVHVQADGSYSNIHLVDKRRVLISKSLKEVEKLLPANSFFRLHSSHLINMNHLSMYKKQEGGYAIRSDGCQLPVARRRKTEFIELLSSNGQEVIRSHT